MSVIDRKRLEDDLARLKSEFTRIEAEYLTVRQKITNLEGALTVLKVYEVGDDAEDTPYRDLNIADSIELYLKTAGGPVKMTDIREELSRRGKLRGNPNSRYGTLVQTMQRHRDRFEQVTTGVWRLAESAVAPTNGTQPTEPVYLDGDVREDGSLVEENER